MTTVGYGDVVPTTVPGRIVAIVTAMWGAFLISLMVLTVGQIFALNEKEEQANDHLKKARTAARAISAFLKMLIVKKRFRIFKESNLLDANSATYQPEVTASERDFILALTEFKQMNKAQFK